jgi:hypothetical protein
MFTGDQIKGPINHFTILAKSLRQLQTAAYQYCKICVLFASGGSAYQYVLPNLSAIQRDSKDHFLRQS